MKQVVHPGLVAWLDPDHHHVLRNAGRERIVLVEFEIKR